MTLPLGDGPLRGWTLTPGPRPARERTLRGALLQWLHLHAAGADELELQLLTHCPAGGEFDLVEHVVAGLRNRRNELIEQLQTFKSFSDEDAELEDPPPAPAAAPAEPLVQPTDELVDVLHLGVELLARLRTPEAHELAARAEHEKTYPAREMKRGAYCCAICLQRIETGEQIRTVAGSSRKRVHASCVHRVKQVVWFDRNPREETTS